MIVHLDTSTLIDALCSPRRSYAPLRAAFADGHRIHLSSLVLYEWRRGPRTDIELQDQDALFPAEEAVSFDRLTASRAADLYRTVRRARQRAIDLAIAACAIEHDAAFWTLNPEDFDDIPGLVLFRP